MHTGCCFTGGHCPLGTLVSGPSKDRLHQSATGAGGAWWQEVQEALGLLKHRGRSSATDQHQLHPLTFQIRQSFCRNPRSPNVTPAGAFAAASLESGSGVTTACHLFSMQTTILFRLGDITRSCELLHARRGCKRKGFFLGGGNPFSPPVYASLHTPGLFYSPK